MPTSTVMSIAGSPVFFTLVFFLSLSGRPQADDTGYLFWEYPANLIAQRLPVGTVISCFV
jgi:hypothetical protein